MKIDKDITGNHSIEEGLPMCEEQTGRVIGVFYNDYDLNEVIKIINAHDDLINSLKGMTDLIDEFNVRIEPWNQIDGEHIQDARHLLSTMDDKIEWKY